MRSSDWSSDVCSSDLVVTAEEEDERFHAFWAHSREEEKAAFQAAIDFMVERLAQHPGARIYHYAAYEETALKRLAMLHGTREVEVDDLLRHHKTGRASCRERVCQ